MSEARLILGDALGVLPTLGADTFDALVTDPPAGIGFMGKKWDANRGGSACWIDWLASIMVGCLRVCRPGAVALVWALPRTSHWTALALEEAGWLIEDRIAHLFGQGFPKHRSKLKPACEDWWLCRKPGPLWLGVEGGRIGTDVVKTSGDLKAFDRRRFEQGTRPRRYNTEQAPSEHVGRWPANVCLSHHPRCGECRQCNGDGLDPVDIYGCCEVCRGTGQGNECHPECPVRLLDEQAGQCGGGPGRHTRGASTRTYGGGKGFTAATGEEVGFGDSGGASRFFARFSGEVVFDCAKTMMEAWHSEHATTAAENSTRSSDHAVSVLEAVVAWASRGAIQLSDCQGLSTRVTQSELRRLCENAIALILSSERRHLPAPRPGAPTLSSILASAAVALSQTGTTTTTIGLPTSAGGAVVATFKVTPENAAPGEADSASRFIYCAKASKKDRGEGNTHPTVKPLTLMRWLVRLACPAGGSVLDPFAGSGTTLLACLAEGRGCVGIERELDYHAIARKRIAEAQGPLFAQAVS